MCVGVETWGSAFYPGLHPGLQIFRAYSAFHKYILIGDIQTNKEQRITPLLRRSGSPLRSDKEQPAFAEDFTKAPSSKESFVLQRKLRRAKRQTTNTTIDHFQLNSTFTTFI
jgi:hypothetical protein